MSRYHNIGDASQQPPHSTLPPITASNSTAPPLFSATHPVSRSRHEQQTTYQPQRSSPTFPAMAILPTLPPISTLSCDNLLPPILSSSQQGSGSYVYRGQSNSDRVEQHTRYSGGSSLHSLSTQTTPVPYPASSTSFSSLHQSTSQSPQTQPPYYQQTIAPPPPPSQPPRSPSTSYYPQPNYSSSYPPYQPPSPPTQQSTSRRQPPPPPPSSSSSHQSQPPFFSQQNSPYLPQISPQSSHSHQSSQQSSPSSLIQPHSGIPPMRPFQRSHTSQNVISEPFVTVTPELNNRPPRRRRRPPFSYSSLIAQAILDSTDKRLTLREVYQWIMERYPQLYKADDTGWQNTIRHNLSLNKCFKKVPRSDTELGHSTSSSAASKGKGGYWTIDPEYMSAYHDGVFARGGVQKRRPGEVGLHPGMSSNVGIDDDSGGSDTSPPDNMAGRLVDVEEDGEGVGLHHHNHNNNNFHHMHHKGIPPLQLTMPTANMPSSSSLMTPPPTASTLMSNKHKSNKLFYKRHSPESSFTGITPTSASSNFTGTSGSGPGRHEAFHLADANNNSMRERTAMDDGQHSNRDLPPYSIGNRGGASSEWNMSVKRETNISMDVDQRDDVHSNHSSSPSSIPYHYGNHSITPERNASRSMIDVKREEDSSYSLIKSEVEDVSYVNIKREEASSLPNSSALGSSMKIRDLLN